MIKRQLTQDEIGALYTGFDQLCLIADTYENLAHSYEAKSKAATDVTTKEHYAYAASLFAQNERNVRQSVQSTNEAIRWLTEPLSENTEHGTNSQP